MQYNRETDRTDGFRHRRTDIDPTVPRTIQPIDPAVILVVEPVGIPRMQPQAMRIVPELRIGVRQNSALTPRFSGRQSAPPSVDSKTPPLDIPMYK